MGSVCSRVNIENVAIDNLQLRSICFSVQCVTAVECWLAAWSHGFQKKLAPVLFTSSRRILRPMFFKYLDQHVRRLHLSVAPRLCPAKYHIALHGSRAALSSQATQKRRFYDFHRHKPWRSSQRSRALSWLALITIFSFVDKGWYSLMYVILGKLHDIMKPTSVHRVSAWDASKLATLTVYSFASSMLLQFSSRQEVSLASPVFSAEDARYHNILTQLQRLLLWLPTRKFFKKHGGFQEEVSLDAVLVAIQLFANLWYSSIVWLDSCCATQHHAAPWYGGDRLKDRFVLWVACADHALLSATMW